ncbi:aminoacylase [Culex quinquefasciatus]|uniref:N-acyl-aliphatic-L-amino acid amidohydrolase n=1 Tax=Culex quinquefasciatus TaxID=7176 RepID=B0WSY8_CULQU|nr:aminoacylase [Culex quinquefasciatus]|eukprot:XP_001870752.1 aminoacylase [Culex quinquefasciatus]
MCEKGSQCYKKFQEWESNEEIQIFRDYLRIPSVHPDVNYDACVDFLKRQAASLDLPVQVIEVNPGKPIVIISWEGADPSAKSIILNSHMDVVPVYAERWSHPPFAAHMTTEGRIYARGAQDMKCVGMQFLGAIRALRREGVVLKRTLHATFVPDEEIGGKLGMKEFVHQEGFRRLNCGFAIDEGIAGPGEEFPLFYGERSVWHVLFHISGTPGHGSLLLKGTAGEKARYVIDKLMDMRAREVKKMEDNPELTIGDVTTVNITMMSGGVQSNVVPPELMVCFDVRVAVDVKHLELENQLLDWCREAGGGIELEYDQKSPYVKPTTLDGSNPYWVAFKDSLDELGLKVKPQIFPGGTDSRYIRGVGIPAIGFSPMNNTPVLLHDHDEFLDADVYLKGIDIYKKIIANVANA